MADTLGAGGVYRDPLWRLRVTLTPLEVELLRCWPVRRLAFVAFAGASSIASTQRDTRLDHSLGVLSLATRFAPDDGPARAAALLHDVGHLPFSHTLEGIGGLEHHDLGADRIRELDPVLRRHGTDAEEVVAVLDGTQRSVLTPPPGVLKLDHLDGLLRSAQAHGRSVSPAPDVLARVTVVDGGVSTDAGTAAELAGVIADEARLHTAPLNVVTDAVLRDLVARWLAAGPDRCDVLPTLTDDELWAALLADPATAASTRLLRRDPTAWRVAPAADAAPANALSVVVRRLYLSLPLVDGRALPTPHPAFAGLPDLPVAFAVVPPDVMV